MHNGCEGKYRNLRVEIGAFHRETDDLPSGIVSKLRVYYVLHSQKYMYTVYNEFSSLKSVNYTHKPMQTTHNQATAD